MKIPIYDYLFFCYYKTFRVIKREVDIDHSLASDFLSVIISFNILAFFMLIFPKLTKILIHSFNGFLIAGIVMIIIYLTNKRLFLNNNRYREIISYYENNPSLSNLGICLLISIFLTIFTFVLFLLII